MGFWVLFVLVKLMNFKLGTCLVLYVIYEIEIVFKFMYLGTVICRLKLIVTLLHMKLDSVCALRLST